MSPDDAKRLWYHDVPREEAEEVASTLKPQSIGVFWSVTTTAAWRYIPSAYVLCKNDRAFPKQLAEILLKGAKSMGPNMVDIVEECESGHFPMLSKPDWVVDFLLRVVGEKGEKV